MAPVRPRDLYNSALICILPAAALTVALAQSLSRAMQLDPGFLAKTLVAFAAGTALVLVGLRRHHPFGTFGAANQVTVSRATLVAVMAGLIGERADTGEPALVTALAIIVAGLDAVDGWLARRSRMQSGFGARFDMETDAALIMVLALLAWQYQRAGGWVLMSGLLRYLFVAAAWVLPVLRRPLPPSLRRKTMAVVQMVALIGAVAPVVPDAVAWRIAAVGLVGLLLSFATDVCWLATAPAAGGRVRG